MMKHWDWAMQVQKHCAIPQYKKWHPGCDIMEIDDLGVDNTNFRRFDFSGLDKVLFLKNGQKIDVAQRFRRPAKKEYYTIDFSFRYMTYGQGYQNKDAEYFNFIEAYKQGHYYPNRYAFGITKTDDAKSGFEVFNIYNLGEMLRAIINNKIQPVGIHPNPDDGKKAIYFRLGDLEDYAPRHEFIMKFSKGRRPLNGKRIPNVIRHNNIKMTGEFKMHPTQKPRGLMEILIEKSSNPGDIVADFYGGSYSVPRAAMRMFRKSIGVELNPATHKAGVQMVNKDLHKDPVYKLDWTKIKNVDVIYDW